MDPTAIITIKPLVLRFPFIIYPSNFLVRMGRGGTPSLDPTAIITIKPLVLRFPFIIYPSNFLVRMGRGGTPSLDPTAIITIKSSVMWNSGYTPCHYTHLCLRSYQTVIFLYAVLTTSYYQSTCICNRFTRASNTSLPPCKESLRVISTTQL